MNHQVIRHILGTLIVVLSTSCGGAFDVYSPQQIHRTVQVVEPGTYVVDYEWPYVEKKFGKDRATAVPAYLKAKGLIPPECTQGVSVIRGNDGEGGKAWAEFRCKE